MEILQRNSNFFSAHISASHLNMNRLLIVLLLSLLSLQLCVIHRASASIRSSSSQRSLQRYISAATIIKQPSKCTYNGINVKAGDYYRLPDTVEPKRYRLRLRMDNRAEKMFGHAMISLFIHNNTNVIEFNSVNLNIHAVSFKTRTITVDAQIIYNCPEKETAVIWFPKQLHRGSGNLTVSFSGNLTWLIENGVIQGERRFSYMFADLGPTDARKKFPSWDEPRFRTPFDLYMIVPKNNIAFSNMATAKRRSYSEQLDEIRFKTTPPISTYQLATVFGPKFHTTSIQSNSTSVQIQLHSTTFRSHSTWQTALEMSEKLLNFYEFYFNHSYPLKKLDLLALKEFVPSSTEKLGILFFDEKELIITNRSLATEEELNKLAKVLAHSLAHQWLGNIVSLREWKEFWLFESLASFMEHEALDSLFPQWKTWESFRGNEFLKSLRYDSNSRTKPLDVMIQNPNDLQLIYSSANCFQKGVSLFRMLKSSLGEERFQQSLQNFIKTYDNKASSLAQLKFIFSRTVDQLSPRKVEKTFYSKVLSTIFTWTKVSGYPVIEIEEKQDGDNRVLFLKQDKFVDNDFSNSSSKSTQLWSIPIGFVNAFNPFSVTSKAMFEHKKIRIVLNNILTDEWVKLNPYAANYYRVKYSPEMLKKFELSIEEKLLSPMDRLNILDDLFAFIKRGDYPTELGLQMLRHYVNEDNPNVWQTIQTSLGDIQTLISNMNDPKLAKKFNHFGSGIIMKNFEKLGWTANISELSVGYKMRIDDYATQKVREKVLCLAGRFGNEIFLREAQEKYFDYINGKSDLSIGALECVFQNVGNFHNRTNLDRLFKFYRDYDLIEARQLFSLAIGSTAQKRDIKSVMTFLMDRTVKPENVHTILQMMSARSLELRREVGREIVKNFYTFAKKFQNPNVFYYFLKALIESFASRAEVENLKQLLSKDSHLKPFDKSLQFAFDRVAMFENWAKRDRKRIDAFLTQYDVQSRTTTTTMPPNSFNDIENSFFSFDHFEQKK